MVMLDNVSDRDLENMAFSKDKERVIDWFGYLVTELRSISLGGYVLSSDESAVRANLKDIYDCGCLLVKKVSVGNFVDSNYQLAKIKDSISKIKKLETTEYIHSDPTWKSLFLGKPGRQRQDVVPLARIGTLAFIDLAFAVERLIGNYKVLCLEAEHGIIEKRRIESKDLAAAINRIVVGLCSSGCLKEGDCFVIGRYVEIIGAVTEFFSKEETLSSQEQQQATAAIFSMYQKCGIENKPEILDDTQ